MKIIPHLGRKTYSGPIYLLESNQIFVFGSNTQGRHGKGAAKYAFDNFGAKYHQSQGIQGKSYAIITKDLTKGFHPSRTQDQIKEQIFHLYHYASHNPSKEFLISYSGENSYFLNGYTTQQMADMFRTYRVPINIVFEEKFAMLIFQAK